MINLSKKKRDKKGKSFLALQFHRIAFLISGILLTVALISAYSVYMEGNRAKVNAQQSLEEVEQVLLRNDQEKPRNPSEPPNTYEEHSEEQGIFEDDNEEQPVNPLELSSEAAEAAGTGYTAIAKVQSEKIGLNASVLSEWSYDLLDISVNKFHGPEPNEPGNFIVIGHNYKNGTHFGSLDLLEIGDLIELTDLSGRTIVYEVYETLIIKPYEVEKLASDSPLALTLITCHTDNEYRLVVKSKATGL